MPVTVFLTTHYIEEARDAQSIGFLRSGKLLVQDSPQNLLERFNTASMEKVFLQLCRKANAEQAAEGLESEDRLSPTVNKEFPFEAVKVENMLEAVNFQNKLVSGHFVIIYTFIYTFILFSGITSTTRHSHFFNNSLTSKFANRNEGLTKWPNC